MRNRKAYLMTYKATGSTMAFDELGEVDDPVALICKWARENLDGSEQKRLIDALVAIDELGQDDLLAGVRPAKREAGHGYLGQDSRGATASKPSSDRRRRSSTTSDAKRGPPMSRATPTSTAFWGKPVRLALKPVAPDAEARKALALAIAEARERQADADKARASFDRVNCLASEAGTAVELAHSAFDTVVAEEGVRLSALLIDASGAPVKVTSAPMRAARERLVDLEDQLAAAKAAREQMRDLVAEPEAEAAMAKTKVEKAKAAVIALHLDPWVQLVERLHAELFPRVRCCGRPSPACTAGATTTSASSGSSTMKA